MRIRNKKGDELMIFPFIFLLIVMGIGIVGGMALFYGGGYDFKKVDAATLNQKIENCLSQNSLDSVQINFYGICGVNKMALIGSSQLFKICKGLNINECVKCSDCSQSLFSSGGDFNSCLITAANANSNYPGCIAREVFINQQKFSIITSSNQRIRRVSA